MWTCHANKDTLPVHFGLPKQYSTAPLPPLHRKGLLLRMYYWFGGTMSRKYLLDCSANGAKWADDVQLAPKTI